MAGRRGLIGSPTDSRMRTSNTVEASGIPVGYLSYHCLTILVDRYGQGRKRVVHELRFGFGFRWCDYCSASTYS
jgi:hypothetical protein